MSFESEKLTQKELQRRFNKLNDKEQALLVSARNLIDSFEDGSDESLMVFYYNKSDILTGLISGSKATSGAAMAGYAIQNPEFCSMLRKVVELLDEDGVGIEEIVKGIHTQVVKPKPQFKIPMKHVIV
jgi:hypothetical protein